MNAFQKLLHAPEPLLTIREIARQPEVWRKTARAVLDRQEEISRFLSARGSLILTGAGSSEFVGRSIEGALRKDLEREVYTVPTTHLVTHCDSVFLPGVDYLLVSFARSGNSPESVATFRRTAERFPRVRQAAITCNRDGELARLAGGRPAAAGAGVLAAGVAAGALCLLLPEETNDQSLAMTCSFSSMALAGLAFGLAGTPAALTALTEKAAAAAERVLSEYGDALESFAHRAFTRACFLGSDTRNGCMQEARLKMQEMTAGRVATMWDSFLGLRHGPQVFVNRECVVVASLSSRPEIQRYELDMLRELKTKKQGRGTLVICGKTDAEVRAAADQVIELYPSGEPLPDEYRALTDVVACQILASFTSLRLGLSPDNPSPEGIINRVVEGITIYPW
jgi:tagatose-6-phosphate ketose/aldose isomerase